MGFLVIFFVFGVYEICFVCFYKFFFGVCVIFKMDFCFLKLNIFRVCFRIMDGVFMYEFYVFLINFIRVGFLKSVRGSD